MVFSDTTTKLGLIQDCEIALFGDSGYGKISGDADRMLQFTARINRRLDEFVRLARSVDGAWQFDDASYTSLPIAKVSIESGKRDYTMDLAMHEIEKVMIYPTATSTTYETIRPADINDGLINEIAENNPTNVGTPNKYDRMGNSIILSPTPDYSAPLGLKVIFKRGPSYFVYTDTDKAPGFDSTLHNYLSRGAALDYAIDRTLTVATNLATEVEKIEQKIKAQLRRRMSDERGEVSGETINSI